MDELNVSIMSFLTNYLAVEARKIADLNSLLQGVDLKGGNVQEIVKGAIGQVVDQAKAKIGDKLKGLEGKVGDKVKAKIGDALKGLEGQAGNKLSGLLGGLLGGNKAKPAPALVEPVIADDSA